jgi:DNA-binding transcriptional MerR regulator
MKRHSTREAARKLGLDWRTIQRYIAAGKIPAPPVETISGWKHRAWSDADIENVRKLLPKIANGRKTRYQKKHSALSSQQSAKAKGKTQPRAAALQKPKKKIKKQIPRPKPGSE